MSTIFFTSDCHFFHKNIVSFCNRPFKDVNDMNEQMIERWNEKITNKDTVYCLGDFIWQTNIEQLKEIILRLNGHKHLILGNHDKFNFHVKSKLWESVEYYKKININKKRFILCHYPIFDFEGAHHQSIHLFGHIHTKNMLDDIYNYHRKHNFKSYCVCADFNDYSPISYEEILNKVESL